MQEAGEVMLEAQKRYETQKAKAEQSSRELAEVTSKLDGIKNQYDEELSSLKFKIEEMELTSDRLQEEKTRIQSELDEVSGGNRDNGIVLGIHRNTYIHTYIHFNVQIYMKYHVVPSL